MALLCSVVLREYVNVSRRTGEHRITQNSRGTMGPNQHPSDRHITILKWTSDSIPLEVCPNQGLMHIDF